MVEKIISAVKYCGFAGMILLISAPVLASYDDALKLYQQKNYQESLKMLARDLNEANDLVSGSPNYNIRFLAAHCHWKLGNIQSAAAHFQRCMTIRKDSIDPYVDLAFCYYDMKDYNAAESTAVRGAKIKQDALLYYILGRIANTRKDYWRAKALFEKANSIDPELGISYNALGIALMNLQKYSEANTAFSVALALNPGSAEIMNNVAQSYDRLANLQKAKEHITRAKNINGGNPVIIQLTAAARICAGSSE